MYVQTLKTRSPWSFGEMQLIRIAENESDLTQHPVELMTKEKFLSGLQEVAEAARGTLYTEEYVTEFYRHMLRGYIKIGEEKRYFFNFSGLTGEELYSVDNFNAMKSVVGYLKDSE